MDSSGVAEEVPTKIESILETFDDGRATTESVYPLLLISLLGLKVLDGTEDNCGQIRNLDDLKRFFQRHAKHCPRNIRRRCSLMGLLRGYIVAGISIR